MVGVRSALHCWTHPSERGHFGGTREIRSSSKFTFPLTQKVKGLNCICSHQTSTRNARDCNQETVTFLKQQIQYYHHAIFITVRPTFTTGPINNKHYATPAGTNITTTRSRTIMTWLFQQRLSATSCVCHGFLGTAHSLALFLVFFLHFVVLSGSQRDVLRDPESCRSWTDIMYFFFSKLAFSVTFAQGLIPVCLANMTINLINENMGNICTCNRIPNNQTLINIC